MSWDPGGQLKHIGVLKVSSSTLGSERSAQAQGKKNVMDLLGSAEKPKALRSMRSAQAHWGSEGPLKRKHTKK
ncbi:unnamed protein product [Prunus armeniaca]